MRKGTLLFFFSDEAGSSASVIPTLSELASAVGADFESYVCTRAWSWQGAVLPAEGNGHLESFYYLANFYEEILYCSLTATPSGQFRREVLAFGGHVISARGTDEQAAFYLDVFRYFALPLPAAALILPDAKPGEKDLAPFCCRDILRLKALGIGERAWLRDEGLLRENGVENVLSVYCAPEGARAIDTLRPDDTYASVTLRIAERNLEGARQIGFIDPACLTRWLTKFCRDGVVPLYEDMDWVPFMKEVKRLADLVGSRDIIGNQIVFEPRTGMVRNNDAVIAELGKYNLIHNLVGVNPRIGFTLPNKLPLPRDWMDDPNVPTPWDEEYSDETLARFLDEGRVPVCFVLYAADLGHLPVLPQFLNMMCLDGMRAGIAFPSTWFDYRPELLEQLYLPLSQGGVCPNLEPMISSVGSAVATEAEGYIAPDFLADLIRGAREHIARCVGERRVPRGIYPFQDASPFYKRGTGVPQYEVISRLGFEYYITYKNGGGRAAVEYEGNGMTVLRQQIPQWFPGAGRPKEIIEKWEREILSRPASDRQADWISMGFDTPFFALAPNYLGEIEFDDMRLGWAKYSGIHYLYEALQYVRRTGGVSGRLFLVKPHELYRFAVLADRMGRVQHG